MDRASEGEIEAEWGEDEPIACYVAGRWIVVQCGDEGIAMNRDEAVDLYQRLHRLLG